MNDYEIQEKIDLYKKYFSILNSKVSITFLSEIESVTIPELLLKVVNNSKGNSIVIGHGDFNKKLKKANKINLYDIYFEEQKEYLKKIGKASNNIDDDEICIFVFAKTLCYSYVRTIIATESGENGIFYFIFRTAKTNYEFIYRFCLDINTLKNITITSAGAYKNKTIYKIDEPFSAYLEYEKIKNSIENETKELLKTYLSKKFNL